MGSDSRVAEGITLEEYVLAQARRERSLTKVLELVYRGFREGSLELVDPEPPRAFHQYLARAGYSMWLYATSAIVLSTVAVALAGGGGLTPLRWFLGTVSVLFLPGYATVEALYPEEGALSPLERVALSIGLSLAVVPLIGLLLNYSPWGIRLGPVLTSLAAYTEGVALLASYRKYLAVRLVAEVGAGRSSRRPRRART